MLLHSRHYFFFFFFNDTATTEIYTLSLHDALPILQLLLAGTAIGEYRGFSFASVSVRSWLALGYLILFGSLVAFTAYNWLLEHYSPTLVATHAYVNPIVAVLLGWLFAGEAVTLNVLFSTAMVIVAVMLVDRGMARLQQAS